MTTGSAFAAVGGSRRDVALLRHEREHEIAPLARAVGMPHRIVERGPLGQRGERRRLRERQSRGRDAEVVARRLLDAVPAVPEVDLVEIRLEDLLLVVVALHFARRVLLVDLARDRARSRAVDQVGVHVADELLRDRARAARVPAQRILERRRRSPTTSTPSCW